MSIRTFISPLIVILFSQLSFAVTAEETTISIFQDKAPTKSIDVAKFHSEFIKIKSKPPHRHLNPEAKVFEYEGISLSSLIRGSGISENTRVHFIGVDGYISTIPYSILVKSTAILAINKSGVPLTHREGGLQVIYDTESAKAVDKRYAEKAAFWCWYVRSIVIGDLPLPKSLKKFADLKHPLPIVITPPSVFQFDPQTCPGMSRYPVTKSISVQFLTGESKVLDTKYDLILQNNVGASPVHCGGPIMFVERGKVPADGKSFRPNELISGVVGMM